MMLVKYVDVEMYQDMRELAGEISDLIYREKTVCLHLVINTFLVEISLLIVVQILQTYVKNILCMERSVVHRVGKRWLSVAQKRTQDHSMGVGVIIGGT